MKGRLGEIKNKEAHTRDAQTHKHTHTQREREWVSEWMREWESERRERVKYIIQGEIINSIVPIVFVLGYCCYCVCKR